MSNINAKYSFIPWLRRGLSRQIVESDTLGKSEGLALKRAKIDITTTFDLFKGDNNEEKLEKKPEKRSETMTIDLVGPGDVSGIHKAAILQVVPANGVENFESNQLPFIEFFEEDLPWRYTPAKVVGDKLRPWLALLVCKKEDSSCILILKGVVLFR